MIQLCSFSASFHVLARTKANFRLLQEQAAVLIAMCVEPYRPIGSELDITEDDIAWLLRQPEAEMPYVRLFGGDTHICETEADLMHVDGCDFTFADTHGRWPNITEVPIAWDICQYLSEKSGEPNWVLLVQCWNDAGGPAFFIPKHLWQRARIEEHVALSVL